LAGIGGGGIGGERVGIFVVVAGWGGGMVRGASVDGGVAAFGGMGDAVVGRADGSSIFGNVVDARLRGFGGAGRGGGAGGRGGGDGGEGRYPGGYGGGVWRGVRDAVGWVRFCAGGGGAGGDLGLFGRGVCGGLGGAGVGGAAYGLRDQRVAGMVGDWLGGSGGVGVWFGSGGISRVGGRGEAALADYSGRGDRSGSAL